MAKLIVLYPPSADIEAIETMDALRAATSSADGPRAAGHALQMSTGLPTMRVVEDARD